MRIALQILPQEAEKQLSQVRLLALGNRLSILERSEAVLVLAEDQGGPHLLVKAGGVGGQGGVAG